MPPETTPGVVEIINQLPAEVTLQKEPTIWPDNAYAQLTNHNGIHNFFTLFQPIFEASQGPSGTVRWYGQMPAESFVWIEYAVIINSCPAPDQSGQPQLRNAVTVHQTDGTVSVVETTLAVDCTPTEPITHRLYLPLLHADLDVVVDH